jgi:type I restriction enzyme M protein
MAKGLEFIFLMLQYFHVQEFAAKNECLHAVLLPRGAEEAIRKYIGKNLNRIDVITGLSFNLFQCMAIPVCLMVLKSKRNGNSSFYT